MPRSWHASATALKDGTGAPGGFKCGPDAEFVSRAAVVRGMGGEERVEIHLREVLVARIVKLGGRLAPGKFDKFALAHG